MPPPFCHVLYSQYSKAVIKRKGAIHHNGLIRKSIWIAMLVMSEELMYSELTSARAADFFCEW